MREHRWERAGKGRLKDGKKVRAWACLACGAQANSWGPPQQDPRGLVLTDRKGVRGALFCSTAPPDCDVEVAKRVMSS